MEIKIDKTKQQMKTFVELEIKRVEEKSTALLQKTDLSIDKGFSKAIYDVWEHIYKIDRRVSDMKLNASKADYRMASYI